MVTKTGIVAGLVALVVGAAVVAAVAPEPVHPQLADEMTALLAVDEAPRSVRRAVARALLLRDQGEPARARAALAPVTEQDDAGHHLAWYHLGSVLAAQDSLVLAAAAFERAVTLAPRLHPAWRNLGETAYLAGDYARAAAAFERAVALDPWADPELVYYQGVALLQADRASAALAVLEPLLADTAAAPLEWYRGLVSAAVAAGQASRADRSMLHLTEMRPDDAEAWDLAYRQAAAADDPGRAVTNLTIRGYLVPLARAELIQLGDLCMAVDAPVRAVRAYTAALADTAVVASVDEYERLIGAQLAVHDEDAALAAIEVALAARPDERLWRLKGEVMYGREDFAGALAAYTEAAALAPEDRSLDLVRGYCALELGRTGVAAEFLEAATADDRYAQRAREGLRYIRNKQP